MAEFHVASTRIEAEKIHKLWRSLELWIFNFLINHLNTSTVYWPESTAFVVFSWKIQSVGSSTFDISVYRMIHPIALWSSACPLWSYSQNCSSSSRNTSINPFLWCVRKYARSNCIKKSITFNFPKHIWGPLIALDRRGALYGVSYRVSKGHFI